MKTTQIRARCTPELRDAFHSFARRQGIRPSKLLLDIVAHVLRQSDVNLEPASAPVPAERRPIRISLRFSDREHQAIATLAEPFGSVREWLVALARSKIVQGTPQLTGAEIAALYASNRELWAIGRNLNQIARAFNLEVRQSVPLSNVEERLAQLDAIESAIHSHTRCVVGLCNASMNRWDDE